MRAYRTCLHEAGHIVAAKHLIGPSILELKWEAGGGAAVSVESIHAPAGDRAVIALAGVYAERLLAPGPDNGMSAEDKQMVHSAYDDWMGGTYYRPKSEHFMHTVHATTASLVKRHASEIAALADHLHAGHDLPAEYESETAPALRKVKALIQYSKDLDKAAKDLQAAGGHQRGVPSPNVPTAQNPTRADFEERRAAYAASVQAMKDEQFEKRQQREEQLNEMLTYSEAPDRMGPRMTETKHGARGYETKVGGPPRPWEAR